MQCRNTIHRVASDDTEVGHSHHLHVPFLDQRKRTHAADISRPLLLHLLEEPLVDFKNDLQMPWQNLTEEPDTPLFKRLWKQRVVRVGKRPCHNAPCLVP